jgi:hypothetical protein
MGLYFERDKRNKPAKRVVQDSLGHKALFVSAWAYILSEISETNQPNGLCKTRLLGTPVVRLSLLHCLSKCAAHPRFQIIELALFLPSPLLLQYRSGASDRGSSPSSPCVHRYHAAPPRCLGTALCPLLVTAPVDLGGPLVGVHAAPPPTSVQDACLC